MTAGLGAVSSTQTEQLEIKQRREAGGNVERDEEAVMDDYK